MPAVIRSWPRSWLTSPGWSEHPREAHRQGARPGGARAGVALRIRHGDRTAGPHGPDDPGLLDRADCGDAGRPRTRGRSAHLPERAPAARPHTEVTPAVVTPCLTAGLAESPADVGEGMLAYYEADH